jgi:hypothetical protein
MGLVINIERWDMAAAIAMATEGVRAKYSEGTGGGGFGAADIEIGAKLDGAKILCAVERMENKAQHLADWCMFAYASPLWNAKENRNRLVDSVLNDWVLNQSKSDRTLQQKTVKRVKSIIPSIAGSLALEQASGADTTVVNGEVHYHSGLTRSYLISVLVSSDCEESNDETETFRGQRRRYYQTHWEPWAQYIDEIRNVLTRYDVTARKLFKKELEFKSGSN